MASDSSAKDLSSAVYQFSSSGTVANGVTKEELADYVKQETKRSKAIDRQLIQEQSKHKSEIVILLLGTGESGKSTVAKQFRLINHNEYSKEELTTFVTIIHSNVWSAMRGAIRFAEEEEVNLSEKKAAIDSLMAMDTTVLTPEAGVLIGEIWASECFGRIMSHDGFSLDDGVLYFMENLERVSTPGYVPTSQDILHARQKSTGIVETQFVSHNALFRIVDVGGQRSERKKWSMLFADITGIIFCADVSCYDTQLREDPSVNRMLDSINVFAQICSNKDLQSRDIILFLNKTDLLAKKLKRSPFPQELFPGAPAGDVTKEDALKYIQSLYLAKNTNPNKFIYVHHTVATDTPSITAAFTDIVKEIVRKDNVLASF